MIQYFYSRSILAFQLAQGDVFRARGHLLTPSGHRVMRCQSRKSSYLKKYHCDFYVWETEVFLDILTKIRPAELQKAISRYPEGIRRCPWAANTSP